MEDKKSPLKRRFVEDEPELEPPAQFSRQSAMPTTMQKLGLGHDLSNTARIAFGFAPSPLLMPRAGVLNTLQSTKMESDPRTWALDKNESTPLSMHAALVGSQPPAKRPRLQAPPFSQERQGTSGPFSGNGDMSAIPAGSFAQPNQQSLAPHYGSPHTISSSGSSTYAHTPYSSRPSTAGLSSATASTTPDVQQASIVGAGLGSSSVVANAVVPPPTPQTAAVRISPGLLAAWARLNPQSWHGIPYFDVYNIDTVKQELHESLDDFSAIYDARRPFDDTAKVMT